MGRDPFFVYPQTGYSTSQGEVAMPILYFDASNFIAFYFVDHASAQSLAEVDGCDAVRFRNGKALALTAFYEYRDCTVGPYNEVGLAIASVPRGMSTRGTLASLFRSPDSRWIGLSVPDLPVNTEVANAAGREIWGFRKFVAPITYQRHGRGFTSTVSDPDTDDELVKLSGEVGSGVPVPPASLVIYTSLNGQTLRAVAVTRGANRLCRTGSMRLTVAPGSKHRMAENLRMLRLTDAEPTFVSYSDKLQLRLGAGTPVAG